MPPDYSDREVYTPIERIYELALRSLNEQEAQVTEVRGRVGPVVAAGGLGITLLAPSAFVGSHPDGAAELVASLVGAGGAATLVMAVIEVLRPRPLAFSVDGVAVLDAARKIHVLAHAAPFEEAMTRALAHRRAGNAPIIERLSGAFTMALLGLLSELAGLGVAAALGS